MSKVTVTSIDDVKKLHEDGDIGVYVTTIKILTPKDEYASEAEFVSSMTEALTQTQNRMRSSLYLFDFDGKRSSSSIFRP